MYELFTVLLPSPPNNYNCHYRMFTGQNNDLTTKQLTYNNNMQQHQYSMINAKEYNV